MNDFPSNKIVKTSNEIQERKKKAIIIYCSKKAYIKEKCYITITKINRYEIYRQIKKSHTHTNPSSCPQET